MNLCVFIYVLRCLYWSRSVTCSVSAVCMFEFFTVLKVYNVWTQTCVAHLNIRIVVRSD